jgi:hypothetical protein
MLLSCLILWRVQARIPPATPKAPPANPFVSVPSIALQNKDLTRIVRASSLGPWRGLLRHLSRDGWVRKQILLLGFDFVE